MQLTYNEKRLLDHLRHLDCLEKGAIKFQRTLAVRFKVCARTIRRWLTKLRECGFLTAIHRRGRTSARYEMSTRVSTQEGQNVHSGEAPPIITELNTEKAQREIPKKGTQMETGLSFRELRNLSGFEDFIALFVMAGKPINAGDVVAAKTLWPLLSAQDKGLCLEALEKQLRRTASADHMPLPVNYLRARPWTRVAASRRTLPYEKPSKRLEQLKRAWEYLQDEGVA